MQTTIRYSQINGETTIYRDRNAGNGVVSNQSQNVPSFVFDSKHGVPYNLIRETLDRIEGTGEIHGITVIIDHTDYITVD
jgi:hypothetical protein